MKLKDIIKTDNIIRSTPDSALSSTLSKLTSSHDAAFVFDSNDKFVGVVNPYLCLIKTSLPGNAKLQHCLFHPPKIHLKDSVAKIAQLMTESRLHYLPVFDETDSFLGIISARRLLASFADAPVFHISLQKVLKTKPLPLVSIYEDDTLAKAMNLYKAHKVSKLVVIGKDMKLKGVLSHYDLISSLVAPKEKEHRGDRLGNKTHFKNLKVKNLAKTFVLTLTAENSLKEALDMILDKKIGSVVIVDSENHPIGIVTTRDILNVLRKSNVEKPIEVTSKNLSQQNKKIVASFFDKLTTLINKLPAVQRARLLVKEEKGGSLFKVVLSLIPRKGDPTVFEKEGRDLQKVLNDIKTNEKEKQS